jgi:cell wall-associated NlpC family hydrolase
VGVQLERVSRDQIRTVTPVDRTTAQPGDLIYYPGHVSLYLGVDDFIIHSPFTGRSVEFSHIRSGRSVLFGNPLG